MNGIICIIVLIGVLGVTHINGQGQQPACAAINEYCQNHWDCCSKSCLSFSYKCVASAQPIQPTFTELGNRFGDGNSRPSFEGLHPIFQQGNVFPGGEQIPVYDSLDDLLNSHFGNRPVAPAPVIPVQPQRIPSIPNNGNGLNTNTLGGVVNRFGETTATTDNNTQCLKIGNRCYNTTDCCSLNCSYNICFAGYDHPNGPELSHTGKCVPLGGKCFSHTECCSGRCHGFLHQCVT